MSLAFSLLIQAAAAPAPPGIAVIDFDLGRFQPSGLREFGDRRGCDRSDPTAITICARRPAASYPLDEMARIFEPGRIVAETRLAPGIMGDIHVEEGPADRGVTPQRLMVRARIPF
jgi:hypothetical protein